MVKNQRGNYILTCYAQQFYPSKGRSGHSSETNEDACLSTEVIMNKSSKRSVGILMCMKAILTDYGLN